jgi:hypothetical protein
MYTCTREQLCTFLVKQVILDDYRLPPPLPLYLFIYDQVGEDIKIVTWNFLFYTEYIWCMLTSKIIRFWTSLFRQNG